MWAKHYNIFVKDDKPISTKILQSCIRYSDYFSDPERKKPVPSDLRFSDSSEPGNINDTGTVLANMTTNVYT